MRMATREKNRKITAVGEDVEELKLVYTVVVVQPHSHV